jgi:hypothetical protein
MVRAGTPPCSIGLASSGICGSPDFDPQIPGRSRTDGSSPTLPPSPSDRYLPPSVDPLTLIHRYQADFEPVVRARPCLLPIGSASAGTCGYPDLDPQIPVRFRTDGSSPSLPPSQSDWYVPASGDPLILSHRRRADFRADGARPGLRLDCLGFTRNPPGIHIRE